MQRFYLVSALLHLYVAARLLPDLWSLSAPAGVVLAVWVLVSTLIIPFAFSARRSSPQRLSLALAWAGLIAMGSFSSLFVLSLLRDIAFAALLAMSRFFSDVAVVDRFQEWSAVAVPVLSSLLTAIGYVNARRRAVVRTVEVPIPDLPERLQGFTIVQISDIHVGTTIKGNYVSAIVDAVNELHADIIAVTGDLVDGSVPSLKPHVEPLSRLSARHGTYFVTGNHEYYSGVHPWMTALRSLGMRVLLNEHVVIQHEGAALVVAGVTDYHAHHFDRAHASDPQRALAGAPRDAAVSVLLAHQPRSAYAAQRAGFDLQLSGHTHGGQFLPWNLFVRFQQPFTAGLHRLGDLWVYVSRGTGYWGPPKRLGAPSEITRLRLVRG